MKPIFCLILSTLMALPAHAEVVENPVETYWQWAQNSNDNDDSPAVDLCLEKIYADNEDLGICQKAIVDLSATPLNSHRREILISLLKKIPTARLTRFQNDLMSGLFLTYPELNEDGAAPRKKSSLISATEVKAWRKVLSQKSNLQNSWVSLNGQPLVLASRFNPPNGIYQWTLVTADLDPVVVVGSWAEFSAEVKNLKPRSELAQWLPKARAGSPAGEHLGDLSDLPTSQSTTTASSSHSWILPVVIAVGVGLVFALKDKQVTVKMPGQN